MSAHVLLVHQLFITGSEAGGTRHAELARHLCDAGHRITVIAGNRSYLSGEPLRGELEGPPGLVVRRTWSTKGRGSGFVSRVTNFLSFTVSSAIAGLRVANVDAVYGTTPPLFQALTALVLARLKRVPLILEVRDLWPDFAVALGALTHPMLIAVARRVEAMLYRSADVVVVNSPGFVEHVRARGAQRVVVIPNGVDASGFDPALSGAAFREEFGLGDRTVALYAGAHGTPNDLDVVLDAAKELVDDAELVFVLVGDGREKQRLVARARNEGLANVVFVPPQPKTRMAEVLAAADIGLAVLAPIDLFSTVYPNKIFDYMAAGRPTVLLIDGVAREVIESAGAGTFSAPGDAQALARQIVRYAADPELRAKEGAAGRQAVVNRFARAAHGDALVELVHDITGRTPSFVAERHA